MKQPAYNDEEKDIAQEWAIPGTEKQLAERIARYRVKILGEAASRAHEAVGNMLMDDEDLLMMDAILNNSIYLAQDAKE
jgi:hypothetical protein